MAYSKKVIEKFENTLNEPEKNSVGRWNPSDTDIGTGMVGAPACGDVMRLQIKCQPKNNSHVISDVKFKTYGCGSAIASSSETSPLSRLSTSFSNSFIASSKVSFSSSVLLITI